MPKPQKSTCPTQKRRILQTTGMTPRQWKAFRATQRRIIIASNVRKVPPKPASHVTHRHRPGRHTWGGSGPIAPHGRARKAKYAAKIGGKKGQRPGKEQRKKSQEKRKTKQGKAPKSASSFLSNL